MFLTCSPALIEWHCRENGWNAQDYGPQTLEASLPQQTMVVTRVQVCRSHDEREDPWPRMEKGCDKDQAKSLDDRGVVGCLLDIDIWQRGTTRLVQDGIMVKGLAPKPLYPLRYHVNPRCDFSDLEKGLPWRTVQDEFSKHR